MTSDTTLITAPQSTGLPRQGGLTLVEMLVALVIAGLALTGIMRVLQGNLNSYSLQTQVMEMQQDTHHAGRVLEETVLQIGADLPDTGLVVVGLASSGDDSVELKVNPRGANVFFADSAATTAARCLKVPDAAGFIKTDSRSLVLVKRFVDRSRPCSLLAIDEGKGGGNFSSGVDTVNDSICLTGQGRFAPGDGLYAYVTDRYYRQGTCIMRNSDTLCENIDSLAFTFRDSANNPTTNWYLMRTVWIVVRGMTQLRQTGYSVYADGRPRYLVTSTMRLRNRI